jgi:hypothetical protein
MKNSLLSQISLCLFASLLPFCGVLEALTLALLVGAAWWYSTRPVPDRPWNKKALKASLSDINVWQDVRATQHGSRTALGKGESGFWEEYQPRKTPDFSRNAPGNGLTPKDKISAGKVVPPNDLPGDVRKRIEH